MNSSGNTFRLISSEPWSPYHGTGLLHVQLGKGRQVLMKAILFIDYATHTAT